MPISRVSSRRGAPLHPKRVNYARKGIRRPSWLMTRWKSLRRPTEREPWAGAHSGNKTVDELSSKLKTTLHIRTYILDQVCVKMASLRATARSGTDGVRATARSGTDGAGVRVVIVDLVHTCTQMMYNNTYFSYLSGRERG